MTLPSVSIIIPAHNEEAGLAALLNSLQDHLRPICASFEIIVVDDGSSDATADIAKIGGAVVVRHPQRQGYGQAIRSALQLCRFPLVGLIDADSSYAASDLARLITKFDGYDLLVGARRGPEYSGSLPKMVGRYLLRFLCEFVAGCRIQDINSGLRVFKKDSITPFLNVLSYGFSFTTSMTLCLLLNGFFVGYEEISYSKRYGASKVRHFQDSLRTLQIICEACARYNPLKLYLLLIISLISYYSLMLLFCVTELLTSPLIWVWVICGGIVHLIIALAILAVILTNRVSRNELNKISSHLR